MIAKHNKKLLPVREAFYKCKKEFFISEKTWFRSLTELLRYFRLVVSAVTGELAYQNGEHADCGGGGKQELF